MNWDKELLLWINHHHNDFWDGIMWFSSSKLGWLPFYLFLVILLAIYYKKRAIVLILLIALLITCSDQIASGILKPLVARLRPSHTPALMDMLHYVHHYHGGTYGFVSSHASNMFSLAFYLTFCTRKKLKWLPWILFPWAFLVSYSRIYLGVHYPTDIIVPFLYSIFLGWIFMKLYDYLSEKIFPEREIPKSESINFSKDDKN